MRPRCQQDGAGDIPELGKRRTRTTSIEQALVDAVKWGDQSRVRVALKKGADVNAKDKNGLTPLDLAKDAAVIKLLRKHGAKK